MMKKSMNFGIFGLLAGSAIAISSLANIAVAQPHSPSQPDGTPHTMPQKMGDQHFLAMMIHHDQKTIQMADLAIEKAENPQIKTLATHLKIQQNQEIKQLQSLSQQLYGSQLPTANMNCRNGMGGMGGGHGMGNMMSLTSWQNDPNFDQKFVQKMIHHQQMSINMASKAAENANSPQIQNLAQAIIKTQTAQIEKLRQIVVDS
jgi:uncharacterized protein (DUF305 family)